jgi:hypothetical protein
MTSMMKSHIAILYIMIGVLEVLGILIVKLLLSALF